MRHRSKSYKHPITIQQRTNAQDDYEDTDAAWEDVVDLWANIRTLSTREQVVAQQKGHFTTHELHCRWHPGIDSKMRVVLKNQTGSDKVLGINNANDVDEEHFELKMLCVEQT